MDGGIPLATTAPSLLRITAEQLEVMATKGAFDHLPRVELRDGLLCHMNPQYFPHGAAKADLIEAFVSGLARLALPLRVLSEVSVRVSDAEVPTPDIFLVQRTRFRAAVPVEHVRLVAEVSDTTLADDLGRKRAIYAQAGVPEYWVVDLNARAILQHWQPEGGVFKHLAVVPFGRDLVAATLPGLVVSTTTLQEDTSGD